MKIITFGLFVFSAYAVSNRIVPRKLCKDCIYYIANKEECSVFGETDFVNGKHDYTPLNI